MVTVSLLRTTSIDHAKPIDCAVIVHVNFKKLEAREDLEEFQELVTSSGCQIVDIVTTTRESSDRRYFVGSGTAEKILAAVQDHKATVVLFNHALTPGQVRNLVNYLSCRVIDRTGLILDIFAARARTFEGKLQVELAQLQHLSSRLVRGWTHLEKQKGGIGLRGPGETQLETDKRLIRNRIETIKERLEKVKMQRKQNRQSRQKANMLTVTLVGYTNAGKSTLFNTLTAADVYVQDQLFATLDPTFRKITIAELGPVIVADTVGFIRHLPHDLVEAFSATLEEARDADLLLHVIDASDVLKEEKIAAVNQVLQQIQADQVPQLLVYNKMDLIDASPCVDRDEAGLPWRVWVSAKMNIGTAELMIAMKERLLTDVMHACLVLRGKQGLIRHKLYELGAILNETINERGEYCLEVKMPRNVFESFLGLW